MKYGANAKKIIDAARERGTPIPQSILNAPIPEDAYQVRVFQAFEQLSTCRQVVMGAVGPIPWSAIDQFAAHLGITDDEIAYDDFVWIIQNLDETFLKRKGEEIAAERRKIDGKSKGVRRSHVAARSRR